MTGWRPGASQQRSLSGSGAHDAESRFTVLTAIETTLGAFPIQLA